MGTWGVNTFENDSALDWVNELAEAEDGVEALTRALVLEREDGYLGSDAAVEALAAAEIVAALLRKPATTLPEDAWNWIQSHSNVDVAHLAPKAIAVIDDILGANSELVELWQENEEDFPAWKSAVRNLRERLTRVSA